jgi:D-alanine-D-alanine ligase
MANDKPTAKALFRSVGLPVADEVVVRRDDAVATTRIVERLGTAVVVKPASQGSGLGVTLLPSVESADDPRLAAALALAFSLDDAVLVERFVQGREVTCGVIDLEGESARALSPTEISPKAAGWYDFQSRYAAGGSEHFCPARLDPATVARVQAVALAAHQVLGVRDLSRADFIVGPGGAEAEVTLLEVNTMPGMTPTSLFPEAAAISGLAFDALCDRLVHGAKRRGVKKINAPAAFPT